MSRYLPPLTQNMVRAAKNSPDSSAGGIVYGRAETHVSRLVVKKS